MVGIVILFLALTATDPIFTMHHMRELKDLAPQQKQLTIDTALVNHAYGDDEAYHTLIEAISKNLVPLSIIKGILPKQLFGLNDASDFLSFTAEERLAMVKLYPPSDPLFADFLVHLKTLAEAGDLDARFLLGYCFELGRGVVKDTFSAIAHYSVAASQDHGASLSRLAILLIDQADDHEDMRPVVELIKRSAAQKDPTGLYLLALHHRHGIGMLYSPGLARKYYRKAAKRKYGPAINTLGALAYRGFGSIANPKAAFTHFQEAAYLGVRTAMYNLAHMYENGTGTKLDKAMARHWYQQAASLGCPHATAKLKHVRAIWIPEFLLEDVERSWHPIEDKMRNL